MRILLLLVVLLVSLSLNGQMTYYIDAVHGNDSNSGILNSPFLTISKGLTALGANTGTLYLRAGSYPSTSQINLSKSGQADNLINIFAYNNEKVVIDFTGNSSDGFRISGSYYHLKGLDIRNAGHFGINISGNNNIIQNCIIRNCSATGLHITGSVAPGPSGNLVLNCDSFYNFDPPIGENADGFAAKWIVGPGNIFRGCRAFNNSDDGWDLWMCTGSILIDSSFSFRNGVDIWHTGQVNGNGNGFKLGGNNVATPHTVKNCVAFDNSGSGGKGFDENSNLAGQTIYNCSSFRNNGRNFGFYNDPLVQGTHIIKNCLSFQSGKDDVIKNAVEEKNSWQGISVVADDFQSIDTTGFAAPRDINGRIPKSTFLHLASTSQLIDAGVFIGNTFNGAAPDIGAFEYVLSTAIEGTDASKFFFDLKQNFPNPFSHVTTIPFTLSRTENVSLKVYNSAGCEVATLISMVMKEGSYSCKWDSNSSESGCYFYVLRINNLVKTRIMIIIN